MITWNVTFDDPSLKFAGVYDQLKTGLQVAGQEWGQYLKGQATIDVKIVPDNSITTMGTKLSNWTLDHFDPSKRATYIRQMQLVRLIPVSTSIVMTPKLQ